MKKTILLLISLFILAQNVAANEQDALKENFLKKIDDVIVVVENSSIEKEERNSKIVEILTPMFDFELMAKLSLGKVWRTLDAEDQKKFIKLYVERMKKSYSSKIDGYSDEKVEITQIKQPKNNRIELITNLISKEDKLEISYKFYKPNKTKQHKDSWLIYDVVILGVSILKTDKAQFQEYLQSHSIQDLMKTL
ncbi:MAG: ABC transporter substrate-binding protein [Arcobacteraceae bacterium]